ncbi:unnamed protein product [Symbiodinium natans]|uniref:Uncharacterized protein n=1 Tax=Symbiodinium natans TaxID=878477 RepID=A0A812SQ22_9DINO|nr:unnamed protein product [Symbiodinium natans]
MGDDGDTCNDRSFVTSRVLRPLWAVPVSKHRVASTLTNDVTTAVLNLKKVSPGVKKSNRGGWHSNTSVLDALPLSVARKLRLILLGAGGQYISHVTRAVSEAGGQRLFGDLQLDLLGLWANVNGRGDSNVAHIHPGLLSGVLYLQAGRDEGATICFSDPRGAPAESAEAEGELDGSKECNSFETFTGVVGLQGLRARDLLIFPSWLQHHVPPHRGTTPRVSLSFNLKVSLVGGKGDLRFLANDTVLGASGSDVSFVRMMELFQNNLSQHVEEQGCPNLPTFRSESPRRDRPPDEVASWIRSSRVAFRWLCARAAGDASRMPTLLQHDPQGSVSLLTLPSGFVQVARTRRPVLSPAAAVSGIHVLEGRVVLWLFDPRVVVEAVAAADPVARKLFGQKIALDMPAGSVAVFPAIVFSSLEVKDASALLSFLLE